MQIAEHCPVCKGQVLYMSPKHISSSACLFLKYDVRDSETAPLTGLLHQFNNELYFNKCGEGRYTDGLVTKLKTADMGVAGEEIDKLMGVSNV